MKKPIIITAVVLIVLALIMGGSYNSLVALNESVDAKWGQVENNLQRRADLIPNLVATVKGYAAHEEDIMNEIADARSRLVGSGSVAEKAEAEAELSSALSRLLVVVENYPNLKADANFRQLQDDLAGEGGENEIALVVVPKEGTAFDEEQFKEDLKSQLPRFMYPKYISFKSEIPRTATNKIEKYKLRNEIINELNLKS
jgi:LemA protein